MNIKIIENPTKEDFEQVITILNEVFSKFSGYTEYTASKALALLNEKKDITVVKVLDENKLVGFAINYNRYEGFYHIWELGVLESQRGNGLASQMYDLIEDFAYKNSYKGITLNTFNRFTSNIRLLFKRGYKIYDIDKSDKYKEDPKLMFRLIF